MGSHLVTQPSAFSSIVRIKQPTVEPVSLFEAKDHLRIAPDVADDDGLIMGLISAARMTLEERLERTFVATQWRAKFCGLSSCWCRGVDIPYPPVLYDRFGGRNVEIYWDDEDGRQLYNPDAIRVDAEAFPGRVAIGETLAGPCCESVGTITWWGGVEKACDVPEPIKVAIKMLVDHWYSHRSAVTDQALAEVPMAVDKLVATMAWKGQF